ncbi:hypothetical protein I204_03616 [Kwoniella mangroviensis CBS 8886]|nr:hypothetical protein I204_03616 [Kwoniella mangroviensis CBS 8886]
MDTDEISPTYDPIIRTSRTSVDNDISSKHPPESNQKKTKSASTSNITTSKLIFNGTRSASGISKPSSHKNYQALSRLSNGFRPRYFTKSQDLSFLVEGNDHVGEVVKPAARDEEDMMEL